MVLHSAWSRANIIFTFAVTCLGCIAGGGILSVMFHQGDPVVSIQNAEVLRMRYVNRNYASGEQAFLSFDIDADLSSVWNWNVKQLFVFLQAEYTTKHSKLNQAIIWDTIIQEEEFSHLQQRKEKCKYALVDVHNQLRGLDVNLTLRWDVMPRVGLIFPGGGPRHNVVPVALPKKYI